MASAAGRRPFTPPTGRHARTPSARRRSTDLRPLTGKASRQCPAGRLPSYLPSDPAEEHHGRGEQPPRRGGQGGLGARWNRGDLAILLCGVLAAMSHHVRRPAPARSTSLPPSSTPWRPLRPPPNPSLPPLPHRCRVQRNEPPALGTPATADAGAGGTGACTPRSGRPRSASVTRPPISTSRSTRWNLIPPRRQPDHRSAGNQGRLLADALRNPRQRFGQHHVRHRPQLGRRGRPLQPPEFSGQQWATGSTVDTATGTIPYRVDSVTTYLKASLKDSPIWDMVPNRRGPHQLLHARTRGGRTWWSRLACRPCGP